MACESGAFTGRDVVVYYAIGCPEVQPTPALPRLGMMRGKTTGVEWETADATGDRALHLPGISSPIKTYRSR
jgi:hypothetical protein